MRRSMCWPGHSVHWIQLRLATETPPTPLALVALRGETIRVTDPHGQLMHLTNHDSLRLSRAVQRAEGIDLRLYEHHVLAIGYAFFSVVRGPWLREACRCRGANVVGGRP